MAALARHAALMARNRAAANRRLHDACSRLSADAFAAPRVSFFPSLQATLNHVLLIDRSCIAGPEGALPDHRVFADPLPCPTLRLLAREQAVLDRQLIALCDGLPDDEALARPVRLDRDGRIDHETLGTVLPHLFQHQIHHRGQAHAMLSGTEVPPPQLDEFFLAAERALCDADLARFGLD